MFWKLVGFLACFSLFALVEPALARQAAVAAKPPLGLALVSKTPSLTWYEKRDGQLVRAGTLNVLEVTAIEEEADSYRVRWTGRQGWVKRDDVVAMRDAVAYFKSRVERDPTDGYAQCVYANELMSAYQSAQAQLPADEAVRLLPNDSRPRQVRINLFMLKKDGKSALDELGVALRLDPSNSVLYLMRASVLTLFQSQYDEALLDVEKALRLSPNDESNYIIRSSIWVHKGDNLKAVIDLDLAIRADPNCLRAHTMRAAFLANFNDPTVYNLPEAIVSARRVCELTKWEDGNYSRWVAQLYERAGNKEEAVRCREKTEAAERANAAQLPPLPAVKP